MLFEIIQDNVDYMFTNGYEDENGTFATRYNSDVSICVNRIIEEYAPYTEQFASTPTRQVIRRVVNNCIATLNDLHMTQRLEYATSQGVH